MSEILQATLHKLCAPIKRTYLKLSLGEHFTIALELINDLTAGQVLLEHLDRQHG